MTPNNQEILDLFIIGGGLHGTGIAADAAGRGLNTALCEQNDLASAASSCSGRIFGGDILFLENLEINQVSRGLTERHIIRHRAPHLCHPIKIHILDNPKIHSRWSLNFGTAVYHYMAGKDEKEIHQQWDQLDQPNNETPPSYPFNNQSYFFENVIDDTRLVIENALAAQQHGADIRHHQKVISTQRENGYWRIQTQTNGGPQREPQADTFYSRTLINASGPWAQTIHCDLTHSDTRCEFKTQQVHYVFLKHFYTGQQGYWIQLGHHNVYSIIPVAPNLVMIGPILTEPLCQEEDKEDNQQWIESHLSPLLSRINQQFQVNLKPEDVVRHQKHNQLILNEPNQSGTDLLREHLLDFNCTDGQTPLVSVFGGRISTYRIVAEQVLAIISPYLPKHRREWTATAPLPGGDFNPEEFELFKQMLRRDYDWIKTPILERYFNQYGRRTEALLSHCQNIAHLGENFGAGLYQREVDFLMAQEWAVNSEDILWRRTELGYFSPLINSQRLEDYMACA